MDKEKILKITLAIFLVAIGVFFYYFARKHYLSEPEVKLTEHKVGTIVFLKTGKGDIKIGLYDETMPITAGNFKQLVTEGFYDGLTFHRVISGFMIQAGDPNGDGTGGPGYTIEDEFTNNNKNNRGTVSMANGGPNTGGSQFFINVVDNDNLNSLHPVFGEVIEGLDVVDAIAQVETDDKDNPVESIVILKASVITQ